MPDISNAVQKGADIMSIFDLNLLFCLLWDSNFELVSEIFVTVVNVLDSCQLITVSSYLFRATDKVFKPLIYERRGRNGKPWQTTDDTDTPCIKLILSVLFCGVLVSCKYFKVNSLKTPFFPIEIIVKMQHDESGAGLNLYVLIRLSANIHIRLCTKTLQERYI
jgi:hypothetical protein